jgi:hypothetical protein
MTELKPCPFCGGKAEQFECEEADNKGGFVIGRPTPTGHAGGLVKHIWLHEIIRFFKRQCPCAYYTGGMWADCNACGKCKVEFVAHQEGD